MSEISKDKPTALLSAKNLRVTFPALRNNDNETVAVDDLSFDIYPQEVVAIVGESGSGKSVTARTLCKLFPKKITNQSGKVIFENQNLISAPEKVLKKIRGTKISYIFQEPSSTINPVFKIGYQLKEVYQRNKIPDWKEKVIKEIQAVGIHEPEKCLEAYPSELSGGMLQRIAIQMALIPKPSLIIADEPTTALDSITQKKIIKILKEIPAQQNTAILFITHDLSLLTDFADRVIVMKDGLLIEEGSTDKILNKPENAYTKRLIASAPKIGANLHRLPV